MSLRAWLDHEGRDWQRRLSMAIEVGELLAENLEAGRRHIDFDPSNVVIGTNGCPRVHSQDPQFIERTTVEGSMVRDTLADSSLPENAMALNSPVSAYDPPERLLGLPINIRSEQFSYCVLVYEALYGAVPFNERQRANFTIPATTPVPFPDRSPVPRGFAQVLERGLAISPNARWPSLRALLDQLSELSELYARVEREQRGRQRAWRFALGTTLLVSSFVAALLAVR